MAVQCDTFMWPSLDLTYHCMSNSDVPTPHTSLDFFPVATRNTHFGHIYSSFPPPSQHQQSLDSDPHAEKTTIGESRDKDLTQSPFIFGQARILSGEIMFIYSKARAHNPPKGRVLTCPTWFPDTKKRNSAIRTSGSGYNVRSSSSIPSFHLKLTRNDRTCPLPLSLCLALSLSTYRSSLRFVHGGGPNPPMRYQTTLDPRSTGYPWSDILYSINRSQFNEHDLFYSSRPSQLDYCVFSLKI